MPPSSVRYSSYYHIWTTICLNDKPNIFGKAKRRADTSGTIAGSVFEEFRKSEYGKFIVIEAIEKLIKQPPPKVVACTAAPIRGLNTYQIFLISVYSFLLDWGDFILILPYSFFLLSTLPYFMFFWRHSHQYMTTAKGGGFLSFIKQIQAHYIILSYSSGGRSTANELNELLNSYGNIIEIENKLQKNVISIME